MLPLTLQFLIAMIASAINERTKRKLDYTLEEVQVVKEAFRAATGKERIPFTPDQRRRLAVVGMELSPALTEAKVPTGGVALPWLLSPQQATVPSVLTPHAWMPPALMETNVPSGGADWP
jgi:hypothetical protein